MQAQPVVLNELVSLNETGIEDEDGDRPDWVEIYNPGSAAINLAGYGLSDDGDDAFKWRFPLVVIPARGFLLVFASGKNRAHGGSELHANFSIRSAGERLRLTRPDGMSASEIPAVALRRDISWGRLPDGGAGGFFLASPTPKTANRGPGFSRLIGAPQFTHESGVYPQDFSLGIHSAEPGASIRYTLDSADPSEISTPYAEPLRISARSRMDNILSLISGTSTANQHTSGWRPPNGRVAKCTVVRARAFAPGALPSPIVARTFFVGEDDPRRFGLPVVSITSDPRGLFDYDRGIYVLGRKFDEYRAAHPAEPLTGHTPANYHGRGPEWDRPAHVELFDPTGALWSRADSVISIQGQSSRSFSQKSIGVRALESDLGPGVFPGLRARGHGAPLEFVGKLRLSNAGNDWSHALMRDALCHRLAADGPVDALAARAVVVYLDGEYWGIHQTREQQDGAFIEYHYGVARPEIILCEGAGRLLEGRPGDELPFAALRGYIETNDLREARHYDYVARRMDVENFLFYQAAEIYFANADWPHNNIRFWRKRTPDTSPGAPAGHDGRWRWMLFDTDLSYSHPWSGGFGDLTLEAATHPQGRPPTIAPWSTVIFRRLLENRQVRDRFISLTADLLNSAFREERAARVIDEMAAEIAVAIPEHIRRWRTMEDSPAGWTNQLRAIRLFANQRPIYLRQHLVRYFGLAGYAPLTLEAIPPRSGGVRVNSLRIGATSDPTSVTNAFPWRGYYFRGVPVRLEAEPAKGFVFAGWQGIPASAGRPVLSIDLEGPANYKALFEPLPARFAAAQLQPDGGLRLHITGIPGTTYVLERSSEFRLWETVAQITPNSSGAATASLQRPPGRSLEFFRLRSETGETISINSPQHSGRE